MTAASGTYYYTRVSAVLQLFEASSSRRVSLLESLLFIELELLQKLFIELEENMRAAFVLCFKLQATLSSSSNFWEIFQATSQLKVVSDEPERKVL